jgi:hypothetical protein
VIFFSIYLILTAALGPGVHSASNRNVYQKQKVMFLGNRALPVRRADYGIVTSHNPIGLHDLLRG